MVNCYMCLSIVIVISQKNILFRRPELSHGIGHEVRFENRIICGMNLVSKVVEIQIPFDHEEAYFSPAINPCRLPEIYRLEGSSSFVASNSPSYRTNDSQAQAK